MSRMDDIEEKITSTLESIDGSTIDRYTYNTATGTVSVYDEVLSLGRNGLDTKKVNHTLYEDESTGIRSTSYEIGQYAASQETLYVIESKMHNAGDEANAKNAIRSKMNDMLDDLIFAFANNHTLNGTASLIKYVDSFKEYEDISNNRIQSGTLKSRWRITYTQDLGNPAIPACA